MKKRMHGWDVASMEAGVPPKQWKNLMSEETKALEAERAKVAALTAERDELKAGQLALEAVVSEVILDVTRLAHENDQLTNALQALVESMPECWGCEELATHWRAGSYVNEEACSRHSGGGLEMTRAPAIRAAVALLAKQREAG